jgi:hypothetical protein
MMRALSRARTSRGAAPPAIQARGPKTCASGSIQATAAFVVSATKQLHRSSAAGYKGFRTCRLEQKLFLAAAFLATAAFAGSYRCTYTYRGLIQRITVQAESPAEARRVVQALWPWGWSSSWRVLIYSPCINYQGRGLYQASRI